MLLHPGLRWGSLQGREKDKKGERKGERNGREGKGMGEKGRGCAVLKNTFKMPCYFMQSVQCIQCQSFVECPSCCCISSSTVIQSA